MLEDRMRQMITPTTNGIEDEMAEWRGTRRTPEREDAVRRAILKLANPKHKAVIGMRFFDGQTLAECAVYLGVTKERVRQIESAALRVLYRELKRSGMDTP